MIFRNLGRTPDPVQKDMNMPIRFDTGRAVKALRLDNGFLKVPATLGVPGIVTYVFGDGSIRRELRTAEELFRKDSLATAELLPVTVEHPNHPRGVVPENATDVTVGYGGDKVERVGDEVHATLMITGPEGLRAIDNGKRELSPAYHVGNLEMTPGIDPDFGEYDAIQRDIQYNHLAIVSAGRNGPEVALHLDSADGVEVRKPTPLRRDSMEKITLNGVDYEVSPAAAQAFRHEQSLRTDSASAAEATLAGITAERDAAVADLEKEKQLRTDAEDPAKLKGAIAARLALVTAAMPILNKDAADLVELSDDDIKRAVVVAVRPSLKDKLLNQDSVYVQAAFDMAVEAHVEKPSAGLANVQPAAQDLNKDAAFDRSTATFEQLQAHNEQMRLDSIKITNSLHQKPLMDSDGKLLNPLTK